MPPAHHAQFFIPSFLSFFRENKELDVIFLFYKEEALKMNSFVEGFMGIFQIGLLLS